MLFFTDLDRTIIFSGKFCDAQTPSAYNCVEEIEGRAISYMTCGANSLFNKLKQHPNLTIIPVTARSPEQASRVQIIQDCKYAVVANGAIVLVNGEPDVYWMDKIQGIVSSLAKEYDEITRRLTNYTHLYERPLICVGGAILHVKIREKLINAADLATLLSTIVDIPGWDYVIQGSKVYICPKTINKGEAVKYLHTKISAITTRNEYMIAAGDGTVDISFLRLADIALVPQGSELAKTNQLDINPIFVPQGLKGTFPLLEFIEHKVKELSV